MDLRKPTSRERTGEMMTWNYRVIRHVERSTKEVWHAIHEVYYDESNTATHYTADAVYPQGETIEELREALADYLLAADLPVLDENAVIGSTCPRRNRKG